MQYVTKARHAYVQNLIAFTMCYESLEELVSDNIIYQENIPKNRRKMERTW
jgi:hypothetical protein